MTPDPLAELQRQVQGLQLENQQLRGELDRRATRAPAAGGSAGSRLWGAGRRGWLIALSLLGIAIPIIQVWLVVQQNQITRNQNKFSELQVYDIVARSMTEGDRNARLMTGALLSRADLGFLGGVVQEAFDPGFAGIYRAEGVHASTRRLEDAAFRGYLVRAVVRAVQIRADGDLDHLFDQTRPMLRRIVVDAADRIPEVLRQGEGGAEVEGGLAEQVDGYLAQVGAVLQTYGRLARAVGRSDDFGKDLRPLLVRVSKLPSLSGNRFELATEASLEAFLFDTAVDAELGDGPPDLDAAGLDPAKARAEGVKKLQALVGEDDGIDWGRVTQTATAT